MTLQTRLSAIRDEFAKRADIPDDVRAALDGHVERLVRSGAADAALKVGEQAPSTSFNGPDGELALADQIDRGPVVLTWIRGDW